LYKNPDLKGEKKKKEQISIIDLGYNSIKISLYYIYKNGHYSKRNQQQDYIRIGHNLTKNNNIIESQNIAKVVKFLNKFKDKSKQMKIGTVIPIATSAIRDAINGKEVVKKIKKSTGFEFNILSGFEEGFFSYLGAQSVMHVPNGIFFDLGGGSIELIHVENFKIKKIVCLNLGTLRLNDDFVKFNEKLEEESNYHQLKEYLYQNIPTLEQFDLNLSVNNKLVGIGGTIRTLCKFIYGIFKNSSSFSYDHILLTKKLVDHSNNFFKGLSRQELLSLKLIDPQRSKNITTGSFIIKVLMEKLGFDKVMVCPSGLREGILENYLYLNMDKKYRLKKKFIEINYTGLSSIIHSNYNRPLFRAEIRSFPNQEVLSKQYREDFPLKINISKLNKII
jgi:exopolyphosphatase/guanosine-5'-triphosphate,3'-diphosphate pyrophosphatase